jgi:DNA invertase Pin-like site-specific DNA recombinase
MIINHNAHSFSTCEQPDAGKPRVAFYLRSACTQQGTLAESLAGQRDTLVDLVIKHGLELTGEYSDVAASGRNLNRPGLIQLLQAARAEPRPFDVVLVEDFSRLSRDATQVIQVTTRLAQAGIRLVSADEVTSAALLSAGKPGRGPDVFQ